MRYKPELYEHAKQILAQRKRDAEEKAAENLRAFYALCPQAKEIRSRIQSTGSRAALAVMRGGNVKEELTALKNTNLGLQQEFQGLLSRHGLQEQDIEPNYCCKICNDGGYVDGLMCTCMKMLLKKLCYDELNRITPLEVSGFESFSLQYYTASPPGEQRAMADTLAHCKEYAREFSLRSPNLLFQGKTGLGKTHLSLAIAKAAIEKGYGVIYGSVHNFAVAIERARFENTEESDTGELLSSCDLLILDDLGTEFTSSYTTAVIYNVINTRLMKALPTIISTNLSGGELRERYSDRFLSRIIGTYEILGFVGKDIRTIKRQKGEQI